MGRYGWGGLWVSGETARVPRVLWGAPCGRGDTDGEIRMGRTMGKRRNGESATSIVGGAMRTGRYGWGDTDGEIRMGRTMGKRRNGECHEYCGGGRHADGEIRMGRTMGKRRNGECHEYCGGGAPCGREDTDGALWPHFTMWRHEKDPENCQKILNAHYTWRIWVFIWISPVQSTYRVSQR